MHHFIFATKDSWINSGSNHDTGVSFKDQNYGKDEILEIKKEFFNDSFDYPTRALIYFDLTDLSSSLVSGKMQGDVRYYLRLYEAEGNKELSENYIIAAHPLSQSWHEGVGSFADDPKTTTGVSWTNRQNKPGMTAVTWSVQEGAGYGTSRHGGHFLTGSGIASQSFDNSSPDIEMDITTITRNWLNKTNQNHGLILKFSGSHEDSSNADGSITFGQLKFFSSNTNTIYAPRLEVRWDDHVACSGSNTGSLNALTMSGKVDNFLYMKGLRERYRESEKVKFRIGARKRIIQKTFSTSYQEVTGSYIAEGSGSYSILDVATGETIVPFSAYTSMSCDTESSYFTQWLNGFYPNRVYRIIYKLKYDDGQEIIYDDNFDFKVK